MGVLIHTSQYCINLNGKKIGTIQRFDILIILILFYIYTYINRYVRSPFVQYDNIQWFNIAYIVLEKCIKCKSFYNMPPN